MSKLSERLLSHIKPSACLQTMGSSGRTACDTGWTAVNWRFPSNFKLNIFGFSRQLKIHGPTWNLYPKRSTRQTRVQPQIKIQNFSFLIFQYFLSGEILTKKRKKNWPRENFSSSLEKGGSSFTWPTYVLRFKLFQSAPGERVEDKRALLTWQWLIFHIYSCFSQIKFDSNAIKVKVGRNDWMNSSY